MNKYVFIIFVCAVHSEGSLQDFLYLSGKPDARVIGGSPVDINVVPYVAQLTVYTKNGLVGKCAGCIIDCYNILTAAHCLENLDKVEIRIGSSLADKGGTVYESRNMASHLQYNSDTEDYDIGIVKILEGIKSDKPNCNAVNLVSDTNQPGAGDPTLVCGFGVTENGTTSSRLLCATINVVNRTVCEKQYAVEKMKITKNMYCAGNIQTGNVDACQGDSGSGVTKLNTNDLIGLVSWGKGCGEKDFPGVYTMTSQLYCWILTAKFSPIALPLPELPLICKLLPLDKLF